MQTDTLIMLLALFGAFALGFLAGVFFHVVRRALLGVWRAPGKAARGISRLGRRLAETWRPAPRERPSGPVEPALPSQPISRTVALVLTYPPRRAQELFAMGEQALAAGHDRAAEGHYVTALFWDNGQKLPALHQHIHMRLGAIRARRGDLDGAIKAYERARALAPGDAEPYLQLGQILLRAGKPGQALYELGRAVEIDPHNLDVRYHLYQVYRQSGMQQEAVAQLRLLKAGEDPTAIAGLFLRHGREHLRRDELDSAADDYRLALELFPDDEETLWALGDILRRQGRPAEALRVWARGVWVAPSPALDERLLALADEGLAEQIALVYKRAMLLHPNDGRLPLALGDLAETMGQGAEAAAYWAEAAAVQPDLVQAHLRLERHYDAAGQPEQARGHLRAALMALWGQETVYRCRACGHVTEVEQPYCSACGTWDSLEALPRRELEAGRGLVPVVQTLEGLWGRVRGWLLGPGAHNG